MEVVLIILITVMAVACIAVFGVIISCKNMFDNEE